MKDEEFRDCDLYCISEVDDSSYCALKSKTIDPCVCYTCEHNTMIFGYGFNGQGT